MALRGTIVIGSNTLKSNISSGIVFLFIILGAVLITPHGAYAGSAPLPVSRPAAQAILEAYHQAGGVDGLGEPTTNISATDLGCSQSYLNDEVETALVAPGCGSQVYAVSPRIWDYAKKIDQSQLGLPANDGQAVDGWLRQTFTGGSWGETELITDTKKPANPTMAIWGNFKKYYDIPSNSNRLGWPTTDQYIWQAETRQDFENGSLVWRPEAGIRELPTWATGQLIGSATNNASLYLIQDKHSLSLTSPVIIDSCLRNKPIQRLNPDNLDLTLKSYPVAGQAPVCLSEAEQKAIAWAHAELSSASPAWSNQLGSWWSGNCEVFVEIAFGTQRRAYSAYAHYDYRKSRGQINNDPNPPAGAFVFYGGSADGHVGIALGDGQVISTQGYGGDHKPVWQHSVTGLNNPYLGWASFDGSWPN